MADRLVVDTDGLVGLLRGDPSWVETLRQCEELMTLHTTDINAFELYFGVHKSARQDRNMAAVKGLLNRMRLLHTDEDSMEVAARIAVELEQKGASIDIKDLLVGSIALVHGLPVMTGNVRHLDRIEGLQVWPKKDPDAADQ